MDTDMEMTRTRAIPFSAQLRAHVPQPPDPDVNPNIPPSIPPNAPDEVDLPVDPPVDLPPRENPPDIDDPDKHRPERVLYWPGHRVMLNGRL